MPPPDMPPPEPRDGELSQLPENHPDALRQDIADELTDHLHCALERELVGEPDLRQASKNVLNRFGFPGAIARQLWFDSMKDTIMFQRLQFALVLVMTCACLFLGWLAWSVSYQNAHANQDLAAQLADLAQAINAGQLKEWVPAKLRLVTDDGRPLPEGYRVRLTSPKAINFGSDIQDVSFWFTPNNDGIVDFDLLDRRVYRAEIYSPWDLDTSVDIDTRIATDVDQRLVCPAAPLRHASLALNVTLPEDLRTQQFSFCFHFTQDAEHRLVSDGRSWINTDANHFQLLLSSDEQIYRMEVTDSGHIEPYFLYGEHDGNLFTGSGFGNGFQVSRATPVVLEETTQLWVGKYRMISMFILPKITDANSVDDLPAKSLARASFHMPTRYAKTRQNFEGHLDMPRVFPDFEVRADEDNVWSIRPPEEFVDFIRQQLST